MSRARKSDLDRAVATIRMPAELYDRISDAAEDDDRSINSYVVRLLEQHVPQSSGHHKRGAIA